MPGNEPAEEWVSRRPSPALRPFVAEYVGYLQAGRAPGIHRGLPSPYLTLIVTLDEPVTIAAHPDPAIPPGRYDTLIGGLHTAPALISHEGRQSGIQLALNPCGARALLGLPAGELASVDVDGTEILGSLANELHERIRTAAAWPRRLAILDELLLRRLDQLGHHRDHHPARPFPPELLHAWRRLLASGGTSSVAEVAQEVGWSDRYLARHFRTEIGLTPKVAARVIRFDRTRRILQRHATPADDSGPNLATLAAESGYYDQAHLAREFRSLAGCPPSRWLAEEFGNFQVAPDLDRTASRP
ncbi:helix-turn-helix domain-containing protein [Actinopolymorpha sp. B11F2]|uniref:helix-turn-helix domain-containing protein n=1 Tax=Actinopolymorpha sp. B11F2 TaxID=3160862 RepID=UPI0032E438E4